MKLIVLSILGILFASSASGEIRRGEKRSLIDSDPEVVYVADLVSPTADPVLVGITKPTVVYSTKDGGRKLGMLKPGKVKLIGFDHRACKVQGQGKTGWVSQQVLKAKEGNLQELMATVYEREMEVRKLIAAGEIALGMSREEVARVLGKPTKQSTRTTAKGMSGTMEFIEYEEVKHYRPVIDPYTGATFRQYTHTTQEETSKIVVTFKEDAVSEIERSESEEGGDVRVVVRPIVWWW